MAGDGTDVQNAAFGEAPGGAGAGRKLLVVEDDLPLRNRLARAFERESFKVETAASLKEAYEVTGHFTPEFAVLDLGLPDGHGMELVTYLRELRPGVRIVVITGYDSIASSLVALKAGAIDYLAKPVRAEQVVAAVIGGGEERPNLADRPMSGDRMRWEHIQRVLEQCGRNVSETARLLGMHRRTLQRILHKKAPRT